MTINRCGLHKTDLSALLQVAIVPGKENVARAGIKSLLNWKSVRRDLKVSFVPGAEVANIVIYVNLKRAGQYLIQPSVSYLPEENVAEIESC